MNQIYQAKIRVDLEGKDETLIGEFVYDLCNQAGEPVNVELVKTNVEAVNLTVKIQRVKEITLAVNVIEGGGATQKTSSIEISPKTIRVSGSDALLEGLDVLELGTVNLSEMLTAQTLTFPITLPECITHATGEGARVTVDLSFGDLVTNKLTVTNIVLQNVPEGMVAKNYTGSLEVTVRGPQDLVATLLKASHLTAVADLSNVTPGTHKWPVTIEIDKKFPVVGTIGSYQITLSVEESAEGQNQTEE
jgi:YbbR domain-containing protein